MTPVAAAETSCLGILRSKKRNLRPKRSPGHTLTTNQRREDLLEQRLPRRGSGRPVLLTLHLQPSRPQFGHLFCSALRHLRGTRKLSYHPSFTVFRRAEIVTPAFLEARTG